MVVFKSFIYLENTLRKYWLDNLYNFLVVYCNLVIEADFIIKYENLKFNLSNQ